MNIHELMTIWAWIVVFLGVFGLGVWFTRMIDLIREGKT